MSYSLSIFDGVEFCPGFGTRGVVGGTTMGLGIVEFVSFLALAPELEFPPPPEEDFAFALLLDGSSGTLRIRTLHGNLKKIETKVKVKVYRCMRFCITFSKFPVVPF
jgi:hypothetical protein